MISATVAERVRSGLVETVHHGSVAVADAGGEIIASSGPLDRPFYLRSAAKPFQALISQETGAGLEPAELAMACASHRGHPVHAAIVSAMLSRVGLTESDLRCPPDWPLSEKAKLRLAGRGGSAARLWHNCSGKHAGFLRACLAAGWDPESYLSSDHPLQQRVIGLVSELSGRRVFPVGVDGCGVPVLRTDAAALARLFARLGNEPRLAPVFDAMHRYPGLVAANGEGDAEITTIGDFVAKGGAQGCMGVAARGGPGIAVKSWDGSMEVATVAAVAAMDQVGLLWPEARTRLAAVARPPVCGGGEQVGVVEPRLRLTGP